MERVIFAVLVPAKQQAIKIQTEYYSRKVYDEVVSIPCYHSFDSDTMVMIYTSTREFEKAQNKYRGSKTKKLVRVDSSLVKEFFFDELIVLENSTAWAADAYLDARYAGVTPKEKNNRLAIEKFKPALFVRLFKGGSYEIFKYQDDVVKGSVLWANNLQAIHLQGIENKNEIAMS